VALMEEIGQHWPLAQRKGRLRQPTKIVAATDTELVRGALEASERAFLELVRRYERSVFAVIVRLVRDPSRAEELAQDTFVRAFQRLDTYDAERKFSTWLLAIAHHAAVDELRRRQVRTEPLDEALPSHARASDSKQDTPAMAAERAELRQMLAAAIRGLRPEYAELVALRYEQELALEEIGEITGLPMGTIKSYLHRARTELAASLRARGWRV
jgi:RNA polymerase sigma-70 factor (ECF subfamily)